jgi:AraC-like DNA-binding protein
LDIQKTHRTLVRRFRIDYYRPMADVSEPAFRNFRTTNSERLVEGLRRADLQPCQLSHEPATSELSRLLFPEGCLDIAEFGPEMLFSGVTPSDCYSLVFVLRCPQPGRSFNFEIEHGAGYMGFFSPGTPLDAFTPAGYRHAALTLPADVFHSCLALKNETLPESFLEKGGALRIGNNEQRGIHSVTAALGEMIGDPADPLADQIVRQKAGRSVREAFLGALTSADSHPALPDPTRVTRRYQKLRLARDYIAAHAHGPIYIEDLCRATGLGRRALENLFQNLLGLCPVAYLRNLRLQGTRHSLLEATPESVAVKAIALDWGFWHLGRFSAYYFEHFGEYPSETLSALSHGL